MQNFVSKKIILFDGDCMLCNRFIKIPLKYERIQFIYLSSHSEEGKKLCDEIGVLHNSKMDSVYLVDSHINSYLKESEAVISILRSCAIIHRVIAFMLTLVPEKIRNRIYRSFARNRLRFGKERTCKLPVNIDRTRVFL